MILPAGEPTVLYVHRTRCEGVEGVHIRGICEGFQARGYAVQMVSPPGTTPTATAVTGGSSSLKQRILTFFGSHAPEILFEFAEIVYNFGAARKIRNALRSHRVRLIYERYAIFSIAAALLAKGAQVPLLLEVNYTARTPLLRQRSKLLKPLAVLFDRWIFRRATLLLAVSSVVRDHLIGDYGIAPERILIVPNAADPSQFDPDIDPINRIGHLPLDDRIIIGFVGTFAPWHGLDLLLTAFTQVASQITDVALLLIGDGPERTHIAKVADQRGLEDRVIFAGPVAHDELAQYLARFDVAVLPDTNDYGSPMKLFEYLAMARPIVAPDYGPVLDVLQHDGNALIFQRRNEHSLAAALIDMCIDRKRARRIGLAGRATIVNQRTWQHNVDRILAALSETDASLLAKRHP